MTVAADCRVKIKESEKINKYLDLAREFFFLMEYEGDSDTNCGWCTWNSPLWLGKNIVITGNQRNNQENPDHSIIKIDLNTQKNPGDLRRLAGTRTPVKNQQPVQVGKADWEYPMKS